MPVEEIKDLDELPENLWIHNLVTTAISNINNKEIFVEIVKTFEAICVESGWVDAETYYKKIEEDKELKEELKRQITTKEDYIKKEFEIARKKFSFLVGLLLKKRPVEIIAEL